MINTVNNPQIYRKQEESWWQTCQELASNQSTRN